MTDATFPITTANADLERKDPNDFVLAGGISSARIEALLLSRKLWKIRDELNCKDRTAPDHANPMSRDMADLQDDADHILKLLENMDNRLLYIQENRKRLRIRSDHKPA